MSGDTFSKLFGLPKTTVAIRFVKRIWSDTCHQSDFWSDTNTSKTHANKRYNTQTEQAHNVTDFKNPAHGEIPINIEHSLVSLSVVEQIHKTDAITSHHTLVLDFQTNDTV